MSYTYGRNNLIGSKLYVSDWTRNKDTYVSERISEENILDFFVQEISGGVFLDVADGEEEPREHEIHGDFLNHSEHGDLFGADLKQTTNQTRSVGCLHFE